MPFTRRRMIKTSLALGAALCVPNPARAAQAAYGLLQSPPRRRTLSIVQGATDESRTQFSVVHPAGYAPEAVVSLPDGTAVLAAETRPHRFRGQPMAVTQYFFSGLFPGADFTLTIHGNGAGEILDQRVFRTLDPRPRELKFALCSCMHDRHHAPEIWRSLAADRPDVILFIGDSTYTDEEVRSLAEARPETLWRRFAEARQTLEIYHQPRLTPILAVWDDHDFGDNDTNSVDYPFVQESQKNFLTFFPQDPDYCRFLDRGPGIASAFTFRGQKVLLLDDRSFRLPSGSTDRYAHWGQAQEDWAMEHVLENGGASWLVNGSQFFPSVVWKESVWRNHPKQREGLMKRLRTIDRKVVFASGDVHYSEVSRLEPALLGYESFEVTSSSIHSKSVPGFPTLVPNPRRILSIGDRNYVLVKAYAEAAPRKRDFKVESKGADGRSLFRHDITL